MNLISFKTQQYLLVSQFFIIDLKLQIITSQVKYNRIQQFVIFILKNQKIYMPQRDQQQFDDQIKIIQQKLKQANINTKFAKINKLYQTLITLSEPKIPIYFKYIQWLKKNSKNAMIKTIYERMNAIYRNNIEIMENQLQFLHSIRDFKTLKIQGAKIFSFKDYSTQKLIRYYYLYCKACYYRLEFEDGLKLVKCFDQIVKTKQIYKDNVNFFRCKLLLLQQIGNYQQCLVLNISLQSLIKKEQIQNLLFNRCIILLNLSQYQQLMVLCNKIIENKDIENKTQKVITAALKLASLWKKCLYEELEVEFNSPLLQYIKQPALQLYILIISVLSSINLTQQKLKKFEDKLEQLYYVLMNEIPQSYRDRQNRYFPSFKYLEYFRYYLKFFMQNIKDINKTSKIREMGELLLWTIFSGSRIKQKNYLQMKQIKQQILLQKKYYQEQKEKSESDSQLENKAQTHAIDINQKAPSA